MNTYKVDEVNTDSYYALQQFKRGQWMYCSGEYSCIKGADIPDALEKERNAKYADPSQKGEWRIVDCN